MEVLDLVLGPETWRRLPGPAATTGAFAFGLIGLLVTLAAGAKLVLAETNGERLMCAMLLAAGLALIWSVIVGVRAFLRAGSEQT